MIARKNVKLLAMAGKLQEESKRTRLVSHARGVGRVEVGRRECWAGRVASRCYYVRAH